MNRTVTLCTVVCATAAWLVLSAAAPWVLSDRNAFLRGFVNHEFLAFLGVLVTITLASAANLHLALNSLEEDANTKGISHGGFPNTRARIKMSAAFLLWLLLAAVAVVVVKPLALLAGPNEFRESIANGFAVMILLMSILVLVDLTRVVLSVPPKKPQGR